MKLSTQELLRKLFIPAFEDGAGDGAGDDASDGTGASDGASEGASDGKDKTYTQKQLEGIVQQRLSNQTKAAEKLNNEIEALKQRGQLTATEKNELESRLEQIQNETLTKEQIAANDRKKVEAKNKKQVDELTVDVAKWKGLHTTSTIERDLYDAAAGNKAVSPKQLVKLLRPDSQLVDELDKDKKPTGSLVTQVTLMDVDENGKAVKLKLSPQQAVKRMSELEEHENLFQYDGAGGFGKRNRAAGGNASDIRDLAAKDPKAYMEGRKSGKIEL